MVKTADSGKFVDGVLVGFPISPGRLTRSSIRNFKEHSTPIAARARNEAIAAVMIAPTLPTCGSRCRGCRVCIRTVGKSAEPADAPPMCLGFLNTIVAQEKSAVRFVSMCTLQPMSSLPPVFYRREMEME